MKYGYIIGHITIKNHEKWEEYKSKLPATLEPWDTKLLFRGKLDSILSGNHNHKDTVVIQFPTLQAVKDWHDSTAYQEIVPIREAAANVDLLMYEEG